MCDGIGDGAAEAVAHMMGLRLLDLSQNGRLTDFGVAALRPLTQLTSLVLNSSSQVRCEVLEPVRPHAVMLLSLLTLKGGGRTIMLSFVPVNRVNLRRANERIFSY